VEKLAQSILAKAFRGELVPTEAELARREGREYEAAEKLLERIQEARHTGDVAERKEGRLRQSKCHEHC
jgi:type I restriction enzyme S subunit